MTGHQVLVEPIRGAFREHHPDGRKSTGDLEYRVWQDVRGPSQERSHAHLPTATAHDLFGVPEQGAQLGGDQLHMGEQRRTGRSDRHTLGTSFEQLDSEDSLEF